MDVLILAAGFGSRMGDLTKKIPKPLLSINQKPLIAYAIELIENLPFDNIYVNTHYQADILHRFLKQNYPHIKISHELNILGTGGGIKKIQNQDILILNTDNLWHLEFNKEIKSGINLFQKDNNIENLLLVNSKSNFLDLDISKNLAINFPPVKKNTQFQGCHLLRHSALNSYPEIFDIAKYWKESSQKKKLYGFETSILNPHIGSRELYLKYQK
jgi:NDP-sugar pyrophosphorylase family protein